VAHTNRNAEPSLVLFQSCLVIIDMGACTMTDITPTLPKIERVQRTSCRLFLPVCKCVQDALLTTPFAAGISQRLPLASKAPPASGRANNTSQVVHHPYVCLSTSGPAAGHLQHAVLDEHVGGRPHAISSLRAHAVIAGSAAEATHMHALRRVDVDAWGQRERRRETLGPIGRPTLTAQWEQM
jgi:hypothetical protein